MTKLRTVDVEGRRDGWRFDASERRERDVFFFLEKKFGVDLILSLRIGMTSDPSYCSIEYFSLEM